MRRRRAQWRASASSDEFGHTQYDGGASAWTGREKERWDRGVLVFIVVFALSSALLPLSMLSPFATSITERRHDEARKNLATARREAREFAEMRRSAMTKRREDIEALDAGRPTKGGDLGSEQNPGSPSVGS